MAPPPAAAPPRTHRQAPPPDAIEVGAVFAGGVAGALARAALAHTWTHDTAQWPWATLLVNVVGAFLLGAVAAAFRRGPGRAGVPRALLGTGVCGALTTFSTLQVELVLMLRDGHAGLAAGYGGASLVLGLTAVWAGDHVVRARLGERAA
ncbi:fluoride efflux transporter CrcB [Paraconexibacter antarcticus]|uniref:Fluoride-specific ion channel FluC n=1 Tax=Paraconexibacter antarcticus TaxID=2949664 RepID=A0ABY5DXS3_9ACTN|nr:fluoride efflux transporter CrcB [Paraconexibacter antarcticus]UTI66491.1 fluoride efflux transporter CrcB [Paraconexibacter antarcticus]